MLSHYGMTVAEKLAVADRILDSPLSFERKLSGIVMVLRAPTAHFPRRRRPRRH
ncbi:hypothetical protein [Kribbella qitaiheensis]|uniref:hypothetical protein n=1 Tax=Kribbella qitaiheensis TaxID=1544730 RepID=UPI0019D60D36|nr:hypothetical protein [Kribbella qitaiheensis]